MRRSTRCVSTAAVFLTILGVVIVRDRDGIAAFVSWMKLASQRIESFGTNSKYYQFEPDLISIRAIRCAQNQL